MPLHFVPFKTLVPGAEHGQGLLRLENAIPVLGGIRSLPQPTNDGTYVGRLTSAYVHHYVAGAGSGAYTGDGATEYYGANTDLLTYSGGTFTSRNRTVGGAYNANYTTWVFASFGNDVWAVNGIDHPQRRTDNSGNFANGVTSAFVPLPRFIGPVREFMIAASLNQVGRYFDEFAWSDIDTALDYDSGGASLAGSKRILSRPGQIMGFVGGEFGRFWKRNSMHALQLTGGSDIWRLDVISSTVGTPFPKSIIEARDGYSYFWGGDGFYRQTGLGAPEPIGGEEIASFLVDRNAYVNDVSIRPDDSYAAMQSEDLHMFGVEDPEMGGIFWFYHGEGDNESSGANRWIFYNTRTGAWASGRVSGVNFVCAAANRNFMSDSTTVPRFIVGGYYDNALAESRHFRFQSSTNYGYTLATNRFAIAMDETSSQSRRVRIRGIQPVVATNQVDVGTNYALTALPSTFAVKLFASSDPHFYIHSDAASTQVSPKSDSKTMADADEWGWMPHSLDGNWFLIEATGPASTVATRDLKGAWINYEVLGS